MDEDDGTFREYRDPDYLPRTKQMDDSSLDGRRIEKLKAIFEREFRTELQNKERMLTTVDERLLLARKTFHKLRYAVVNNFYNSKKFELTTDEIQRELTNIKDPTAKPEVLSLLSDEQKRLHPAVKKVINEKLDDLSLDTTPQRPLRKRFKSDIESLASNANNLTIPVNSNLESLRPNNKSEILNNCKNEQFEKNKTNNIENNCNSSMKIPMYIGPKDIDAGVLEIDPVIRNKQKKKFRIIIGNTSKYIASTSKDDFITHRWLLYIRGPKLAPDISHIVDYITIQLHDSYAPQNVVKLKSSPFHLSKRGWGEFPVKLRLHFKNESFNKPVNLIHNLKLDRYHTGIQTLGGETVVDVWLYTDDTMIDKNSDNLEQENNSNEIEDPSPIDLKLVKSEPLDTYEEIQSSILEEDYDVMECVNIKEEPMEVDINVDDNGAFDEDQSNVNNSDNYYINKFDETESASYDSESRQVYSDHSYFINASNWIDSNTYSELDKVIFAHIQSLVNLSYFSEWYENFSVNTTVNNMNFNVEKFVEYNKTLLEKLFENDCNYTDRDTIVENITNVNKYLVKQYMNSIISVFQNGFNEDVESVNKCINILKNVISTNELCAKQDESSENIFFIGRKVLNIMCAVWSSLVRVKDMRCLINTMLKNMPMVDCSADSSVYKKIFFYAVASEEEFFQLDVIKRRNLIWTRAKLINNFLNNFFINSPQANCVWSTKQIMVFGQYHGYFPVKLPINSQIKIENLQRFISTVDKVKLKELFDNVYEINSKTIYNNENEDITKVKLEKNCDLNSLEDGNFCYISDSSDDEIDICDNFNGSKSSTKKHHITVNKISDSKALPFIDKNEMLQCQYIEKVLNRLGLEIRSHNIGNGYVCSLIHKMILAACKSFAEDLIRRSLCVKIEAVNSNESIGVKYLKCLNEGSKVQSIVKSNFKHEAETEIKKEDDDSKSPLPISKIWNVSENGCESEISIRHIFEALKSRKEFDFLTNYGAGSEDINYNGEL